MAAGLPRDGARASGADVLVAGCQPLWKDVPGRKRAAGEVRSQKNLILVFGFGRCGSGGCLGHFTVGGKGFTIRGLRGFKVSRRERLR